MNWHLEREKTGRAYCRSIGANPDEVVRGYSETGEWIERVRWWWYQESSPVALAIPIR